MRKKKAAPLTGSLLSQDKTDRPTGFVISLVDRLKEAQTAADGAPQWPDDEAESPPAKRPAETDPSVDIVDSIRPKSEHRTATASNESDGPGQVEAGLGTPPRNGRSAADPQPPADLGGEDAGNRAPQLVQALRSGDLERAETMLGRMTGLDAGHVRRVLYGAEGRNLAITCRALGIDQLQFISIFMLSRRLGMGEKALEPRKLTHIASFFEQTDEAAARKTLNQWLCYSGD